jgi:hypothetical protein
MGKKPKTPDQPIASVDRASLHEETRFIKRQQWTLTAAGLALLGAVLTAAIALKPLTAFERYWGLVIVNIIPPTFGLFLLSLQFHLSRVRRDIDGSDRYHFVRGLEIVAIYFFALIVGAFVVAHVVGREPTAPPSIPL